MSLGRETEDAIAQPKFKGDDIADGLCTKGDLIIARPKPEDAMNCAILTPSKGRDVPDQKIYPAMQKFSEKKRNTQFLISL